MATTPLQALPVPSLSDPPNGPAQLMALGTAVEKLVVMQFDDAAARSATIPTPTRGMVTLLADTGAMETYYGIVTGWQKPWNLPWGIVGYWDTTGTPGATPTVTWNARAGRFYEIKATAHLEVTGDTTAVDLELNGTLIDRSTMRATGATTSSSSHPFSVIKECVTSASWSATLDVLVGTISPLFSHTLMNVADVGPSGSAPAS